jgi:flagellar hook-associated protein 2
MSTTAAPIFNGTSQFASDLQTTLTRAISIASLPLQQLNDQLTNLNSESSALKSLDSNFGAILSALDSISSGVDTPTAAVSDGTVLTAQTSASALSASYTIDVITPGSQSTALSNTGLSAVSDPTSQSITSSTSLTLTVGSSSFTIKPASNTLNALAAAINSAGAGVSASVINLGDSSAPNYRLSIQSTQLGNASIQLNDGSSNLLQTIQVGTDAQYQVNGQPSTPINSTSSTVIIAPGVTAELLQAGTSKITVGTASSSVDSGISSFISAYNASVDAVAANRGQNAGPLAADPIISTVQQSNRSLVQYTGSGNGTVQSLADLGISLDETGHLSFDQSQFDSLLASNPQDVTSFLGSATTGGFLQAAANNLNALEDPTTGTFQAEETSLANQITRTNQQITAEQNHINLVQTSLTAQITAADSTIASLEQQVSEVTALFAAQNANNTKNG